jgi:3-phosphoshikimate 1-carboxyvinyltransferase
MAMNDNADQNKHYKLVIVGLGLIGGSLAAAIKKFSDSSAANKTNIYETIGIVRRQETADYALKNNIVDRAVFSLDDVANELSAGDIIFISVPTLSFEETLKHVKEKVSGDVTITDGCSVKGSIVDSVQKIYGEIPKQFVPGHPIAGSEQSGVTATNPDLYVNHSVILTPLTETDSNHLDAVAELWSLCGADVLRMPVEEHDIVLAATSHLPHAIAYSLVDTLANDAENENIFRYAAGGFRDFTRIASSDPTMWHDIMCTNQDAILEAIDLFQNNLSNLRQAIENKDSKTLLTIFNRAKQARDDFSQLIEQPKSK